MDTPRPRTSNPLPSSSPFSPRYRSLSSPWGSTPSSPGGGEGTEGTRLGGSTHGGHTRLPSTDSGIQADAGWDSLTRSHHKSSGKDSVVSPESRTPLKTLTRCLMEPRGGWDTDPFSSPTSPTSSSDRYHSLSSAEVRQLAARGRALSCDADVRTMTSGLTNPRPLQLSGGSNVRTINIEFKGQTTPREEGGEKRAGVSRVAGDGVLCKSMDSALPTTSLRTPSSSLGGASEHYKSDGSSSRLGSRAERYRSDPLGRTDPVSSRTEHYGSRPDPLGGSFPVSRGLASRLNPSAFLTSEGYSTSSLPRRNKSREDRTPTSGPLSLLCSSTPVIPSPTGQGSPGSGGWVIGGRDHFYDRPNWLSDEGPVHAAMRIYKRDSSSAVPSSPDTESPPRFLDERHSNHAQQQQQGGYGSPEPQQVRSRVSSSPQGRLVTVSNTNTTTNTVNVASSSSSHSSLSSSGSGRAKALHVHFVDDEVSNTQASSSASASGASRARVATTSPPPSNPPPSSSSSTSRRFPRSTTPPRTQDPPTSSSLSPKEQESKGAGTYVASSRFTATARTDSHSPSPRVAPRTDDSQSSSSRITLRPHDSHSPSPRVTPRTDDSLSPSSRMIPRTQDSQHSPSPRMTPRPDDSKDSSPQGTGASNSHSNPPARRQRQPVEDSLTVKKEEPVSNALPRPEKSPPPEQASNGQGVGTGGRARHINPVYRTKLSPVLPRGNALRAKLSLPPVTSSSSSSSNSSSSSTSTSNPQPVKHVDTCSACLKPVEGDVTGSDVKDDVTVASSAPLPAPPEFLLKLMGKAAGREGGEGGEGRMVPVLDVRKEIPWQERRERINNSLAWLKNELASLRDMDTALVTQFQRCQDTIESLKQQHTDMAQWGDGEGSECGGDEEEAWEDWEIAEFEKKWAEAAKNKKDITLLPATNNNNDVNTNNHVTKGNDVTNGNDVTEGNDVSKSNNNDTPSKDRVTTTEDKTAKSTANGKKSPSPIKQDVEATL